MSCCLIRIVGLWLLTSMIPSQHTYAGERSSGGVPVPFEDRYRFFCNLTSPESPAHYQITIGYQNRWDSLGGHGSAYLFGLASRDQNGFTSNLVEKTVSENTMIDSGKIAFSYEFYDPSDQSSFMFVITIQPGQDTDGYLSAELNIKLAPVFSGHHHHLEGQCSFD